MIWGLGVVCSEQNLRPQNFKVKRIIILRVHLESRPPLPLPLPVSINLWFKPLYYFHTELPATYDYARKFLLSDCKGQMPDALKHVLPTACRSVNRLPHIARSVSSRVAVFLPMNTYHKLKPWPVSECSFSSRCGCEVHRARDSCEPKKCKR